MTISWAFPRTYRIKKQKEIKHIRENGNKYRGKAISIIFTPANQNHDRYAFLVGKRHGNAVKRNRLKRILREAVRHSKPTNDGQFYNALFCPRAMAGIKMHDIAEEIIKWRKQLTH